MKCNSSVEADLILTGIRLRSWRCILEGLPPHSRRTYASRAPQGSAAIHGGSCFCPFRIGDQEFIQDQGQEGQLRFLSSVSVFTWFMSFTLVKKEPSRMTRSTHVKKQPGCTRGGVRTMNSVKKQLNTSLSLFHSPPLGELLAGVSVRLYGNGGQRRSDGASLREDIRTTYFCPLPDGRGSVLQCEFGR